MTDRDFMLKAIALAEEAANDGEVPVGAIIVKDGKIIASGRNRREKGKSAIAHAEIEAIDAACKKVGSWRLNGCEMYVTLEPCPMCTGAVINSRLSAVIFGAYDERAGACFSVSNIPSLMPELHTQVIGGYMQEKCSRILSGFFQKRRN